jgi:hypothetical protein
LEKERLRRKPKECKLTEIDKKEFSKVLFDYTKRTEENLSHYSTYLTHEAYLTTVNSSPIEFLLSNPPSSRKGKRAWTRY